MGFEAHPASYPMGARSSSPGGKLPTSAKVKKTRMYM
jgi:hypothetical protein